MEKRTKVGFISLGCPKNQVDTECMLNDLKNAGYEITAEETEADIIIINTCAFIESAKTEAIDNILDVAWLKTNANLKGIVVAGCLAQRYGAQIFDEIPEVDAMIGVGAVHKIVDAVRAVESRLAGKAETEKYISCEPLAAEALGGDRIVTTPGEIAYLKIAEGCDNRCAYCAIPLIRGGLISRPMEELVAEAQDMDKLGVKELVLVAQDTTVYGRDLYGEYRLVPLIQAITRETKIPWIRILYCYPDKITDALVEEFRTNPRLVNYIDLPVQHLSDRLLKKMNRHGDSAVIYDAVKRLRTVEGMVIRSTFIVGFPGETEDDFAALVQGAEDLRFDKLGVFPYSREEDTPAYDFPDQIAEQIKLDRQDVIMREQLDRVDAANRALLGSTETVLCEGFDPVSESYYGRTYRDAYDIDGKLFFTLTGDWGKKKPGAGDFIQVKITDVMDYDLVGEADKADQ